MQETAYMNQGENEIKRYLNVIWRRRKLLFIVAGIIAGLGTILAIMLPAIYRSSAVILIEQQEIPTELVRSTVTSFADQRIQVISQRAMTTENLTNIIEKYDLYKEEQQTKPREVVLSEMREDINLEMISADVVDPRSGRPTAATIAFSLSYDNRQPGLAQRVANELVSLYLNENLKTRTEAAEETSAFISDEADRLGGLVRALEAKLAEFKQANVEQMPEIANLNRELLDRTHRDIAETERRIQALKDRRTYLDVEISQVKRFTTLRSERGERVVSPLDKLNILESDLATLKARYGATHPDVKTLQRQVDAMSLEASKSGSKRDLLAQVELAKRELTTLQAKYSNDHPDVKKALSQLDILNQELANSPPSLADQLEGEKPDNPAYIQLKAQINAADSEMRTLYTKLEELALKSAKLEDRISMTPSVEGEYRAILREYENTVAKHRELIAKQMEAQLSKTLESERKGEKFTLIEPPLLPEEPYRPNRMAIFLASLLLAFAGSLGSVGLVEAMDNKVRGRAGVLSVTGMPPIGAVPYIEIAGDKRAKFGKKLILIFALLVLATIALLVFHFVVMPLDVFWLVLMRKIGI